MVNNNLMKTKNFNAKILIGLFFVIGAVGILAVGSLSLGEKNGHSPDDFLRFHIRANSNTLEDQTVKYAVKQEILNQFTPTFAGVTSRSQAMRVLDTNITRFESIANTVIASHGFTYTARAMIRSEYFPERSYNGFTLPQGRYDALIIHLGSGSGNNWWCVVYPPLCFLDNNIGGERGVIYRSRLNEIIRRFFN